MYNYLHKESGRRPVAFDTPLDPALYSNLGTTEEDYRRGCWVRLTDSQTAFAKEHPTASVAEILAEAVTVHIPTLDEVKRDKLRAIAEYDISPEVNSFTLGGQSMWLPKADRVGLANSIAIEETEGREVTNLWFGGVKYTIPIAAAKVMLRKLELYALDCYNVTEAHKAAVAALTDVQSVEAYDHTAGYPDKCVFEP